MLCRWLEAVGTAHYQESSKAPSREALTDVGSVAEACTPDPRASALCLSTIQYRSSMPSKIDTVASFVEAAPPGQVG